MSGYQILSYGLDRVVNTPEEKRKHRKKRYERKGGKIKIQGVRYNARTDCSQIVRVILDRNPGWSLQGFVINEYDSDGRKIDG